MLVVAVVAVGLLAGHSGANKPGALAPRVGFGANIQPPAASGGYLEYTNGWMAVSGDHLIGVYAGSEATRRQNGLLVIRRGVTNTPNGIKKKTVVLHRAGAVTLLRPAPPATEDAAFQTTLHFVTANGATGTLNLATDKVTLSG